MMRAKRFWTRGQHDTAEDHRRRRSVRCVAAKMRTIPLMATGVIVMLSATSVVRAGTPFDEAAGRKLVEICDDVKENSETTTAGPNLKLRCKRVASGSNNTGGGSTGGTAGAGLALAPTAVQLRLRELREKGSRAKTSSSTGASSDAALSLGKGFSVFAAPGYERLSKHNNKYEDGYQSDIGRLTLGGDYQFNNWLVAGLALNYAYDDGQYDDGQGFHNQAAGFSLYSSVLPFEGVFLDVVASYTYYDYDETRVARIFDPGTPAIQTFRGSVKSNHRGHGFNGGVLAGYDVPLGRFTIGPRAGLTAGYIFYDNYREKGSTGLELRYDSDSESSLQSSVGAAATMALSTSFGVLLPQIDAAWVHEFADDQRSIDARFIEAPAGTGNFRYDSESPDRNFGIVGVGLTAVLPNGLQPFAAFRSIVGNDNYNSYAVSAGLRLEL